MSESARTAAQPFINVTPLIDVLLVVLIIFMVSAPLRPYSFAARLPAPPDNNLDLIANDLTLVVTIEADRTLRLNALSDMGTVDDPSKLSKALASLFSLRKQNRAYRPEMMSRTDLPDEDRIQKTVFIKAPRNIPYGEVTRIIDAVKGAGADPLGLQIDQLT